MIIDTSKLKLPEIVDYEFYLLRKVKTIVGNRIMTDKGDFMITSDDNIVTLKEGDEILILQLQLSLKELKYSRKKAVKESPELVESYDEDIRIASQSYQGSKLEYGLIHSNKFINLSEFIENY